MHVSKVVSPLPLPSQTESMGKRKAKGILQGVENFFVVPHSPFIPRSFCSLWLKNDHDRHQFLLTY